MTKYADVRKQGPYHRGDMAVQHGSSIGCLRDWVKVAVFVISLVPRPTAGFVHSFIR